MNIQTRHLTPKKKSIKQTRNEFTKLPIKYKKRRKSSIPLHIRELIKNNSLNQLYPDPSSRNNYKCDYINKKFNFDIINSSIPEESENSSNKEAKNKKEIKNEIENNNYYIHYIKNVYEKEPHFSKKCVAKTAKKKSNNNCIKLMDAKQNFRKINKRRNSVLNKNFLNLHNFNLNMNPEPVRSSAKWNTIIKKKKSGDIFSPSNKKEEKSRSFRKNKEKNKSKEKSDTKEDKDTNINNKGDSSKKNSNRLDAKKKIKEKETFENEGKTENGNNSENKNIKETKKKNKFKKFLCCLLSNVESSIEND